MSEYLLTITGIVLISTVFSNFLPGGKTCLLIKNILRLCAYLSVLAPIFKIFTDSSNNGDKFFIDYFNENVIKTDNSYIEYCSKKTINTTEEKIEELLKSEYFIQADVQIVGNEKNDFGELKIEKIVVIINDISTEKQEEIRTDFKSKYSVDIEFTKGG